MNRHFGIFALLVLLISGVSRADTFSIAEHDFLLNGQPFQIKCGEMHFARVPREYWAARLQSLRAMGLNSVCAYLFWNAHEPQEGQFDFTGQQDVAEFVRLAQQADLKVILRPGPYSCAEWDFGGLPWWLLKDPKMQVRTRYPGYFNAQKRYLAEVGKQLAPLQITRGGPIIMVQVENEYGSYGSDGQYIHDTEQAVKEAGFDVPLFNCDGWEQALKYDHGDLYVAFNFGSEVQKNFERRAEQKRFGPNMVSEFYPGWYDRWTEPHHTGSTEQLKKDLGWMLEHNASFSLYMAFGGTTFGFDAGANSPPFVPEITSYDYDAPLDEAGRPTKKFMALRDLLSQHLSSGEKPTPPVPQASPTIAFDGIALHDVASLADNLPSPIAAQQPTSFEMLDVPHGCVLYRTTLPAGPAAKLEFTDLHDYAVISLDGKPLGELARQFKQDSIDLPAREKPAQLDVLVHAFGHINFGQDMGDRKGIAAAKLHAGDTSTVLSDWQQFKLPLNASDLSSLKFHDGSSSDSPSFFRGTITLGHPADTFLDTRGIQGLGVIWINGHNLGRCWSVGPQQTMFVPGPYLKQGENQIVIFTFSPQSQVRVAGLSEPILNEVHERLAK